MFNFEIGQSILIIFLKTNNLSLCIRQFLFYMYRYDYSNEWSIYIYIYIHNDGSYDSNYISLFYALYPKGDMCHSSMVTSWLTNDL